MRTAGYSLVEMMAVVAIAAIALSIAVPSFQESIMSSRTRAVAESIQSGMLTARSEAVRRSAPMRFQLVSTIQAGCTPTDRAHFWVVTQYTGPTVANAISESTNTRGQPWASTTAGAPSVAACNKSLYTPPDPELPCPLPVVHPGGSGKCIDDPFIAARSSVDGATNVDVIGRPALGSSPAKFVVTFGPLGQLLDNLEGARSANTPIAYRVVVTPSSGIRGRSWMIEVSVNGGIKLCSYDTAAFNAASYAKVCS